MTILEAYQQLFINLKKVYDDREAANIADMVMEYVTSFTKVGRLLNKATILTIPQQQKLLNYTDELLKHRPVQYVLGEAWFDGMKFYVNQAVLIPRPETEELVEQVSNSEYQVSNLLDIGSGSGCIPIAIKKRLPNVSVTSIDVSEVALQVAKQNAEDLNADIDFRLIDFLDENNWLQLGIYDVIVSNPPYIKQSESRTMAEHVLAFEPHVALFVPDNDALLFYKKIAVFGKQHLTINGKIFVEINEQLGTEAIAVFEFYGYSAELKKDMQGRDRMIEATINQEAKL